MASNNDGLGFTLVSVGGLLVYAGMKGYSVPAIVSNLVTGKPIYEGVTNQNPLGGNPVTPEQVPGSSGTMQSAAVGISGANQQIANRVAGEYGWQTGVQWDSLVTLWTRESSWDNHAKNPTSGAYGIPQALPYTKMPKPAWPESAGGTSDAETQVRWGMSYIQGRYGVPQFALAFHKQNNWY